MKGLDYVRKALFTRDVCVCVCVNVNFSIEWMGTQLQMHRMGVRPILWVTRKHTRLVWTLPLGITETANADVTCKLSLS